MYILQNYDFKLILNRFVPTAVVIIMHPQHSRDPNEARDIIDWVVVQYFDCKFILNLYVSTVVVHITSIWYTSYEIQLLKIQFW